MSFVYCVTFLIDYMVFEMKTIHEFQVAVIELEKIRGFSEESLSKKVQCLLIEILELVYAIVFRKSNVADEIVDVFSVLMMIVRRRKIDFEKAFDEKYEKDKLRV